MFNVPVPPLPTPRLALVAHVPLETLTVPFPLLPRPITQTKFVTMPPVTFSSPVPLLPTVKSLVLAHVPPDTVTVPLLPAL